MKKFYIKKSTYGTRAPRIIGEEQMNFIVTKAEEGLDSFNPDDYMFHCEAENVLDAVNHYWKNLNGKPLISGRRTTLN